MRQIRDNLGLYLILILAAALLFSNLDSASLSQDEANTAILAERILEFGRPLSFDGKNHIVPECSGHHRQDYTWTYGAWLQDYLTAFSFSIFGKNNFSARFPFVAFGLLSVWLVYSFCIRQLGNKRTACIAAVLLSLSIPYLLHMRNCRYYALNSFFTLAVVDAYLCLQNKSRFSLVCFITSAALLFHSNYGTFPPIILALLVHLVVFRLYRGNLGAYGIGFGSIFILTVPWMVYLRVWQRTAPFNIQAYLGHLIRYAIYLNDWFFPLVLALASVAILLAWRREDEFLGLSRTAVGLLILTSITTVLFVAGYDQIYLRYIIHLFPLLAVLLALTVEQFRFFAYPVLLILLCTNLLSAAPYKLLQFSPVKFSAFAACADNKPLSRILDIFKREYYREGEDLKQRFRRLDNFIDEKAANVIWPPALYFREVITRTSGDSICRIGEYLNQHAGKEELLYTNTEHLPVIFYTDLIVQRPFWGNVKQLVLPEWILIDSTDKSVEHKRLLQELIAKGSYKTVGAYLGEEQWFDKPDYDYPKFSLQKKKTHLTLFHRERR